MATPAVANVDSARSRVYYERALTYVETGELRSAVIELKNALQRDRQNADARLLLGQVYLQLGNGAAAEKELRASLRYGIAMERVVVDLGRGHIQGAFLRRLEEDVFASEGRSNLVHLTVQAPTFEDVDRDGRPDVRLRQVAGTGLCSAGPDGFPRARGEPGDFPSMRCELAEERATCVHATAADVYRCRADGSAPGPGVPMVLPERLRRDLRP